MKIQRVRDSDRHVFSSSGPPKFYSVQCSELQALAGYFPGVVPSQAWHRDFIKHNYFHLTESDKTQNNYNNWIIRVIEIIHCPNW